MARRAGGVYIYIYIYIHIYVYIYVYISLDVHARRKLQINDTGVDNGIKSHEASSKTSAKIDINSIRNQGGAAEALCKLLGRALGGQKTQSLILSGPIWGTRFLQKSLKNIRKGISKSM